jgi:hypothetical protein
MAMSLILGLCRTQRKMKLHQSDVLAARAAQLTLLKQNLAATQNCMKQYADKRRVEKEFQIGDNILLKLQPYAQTTVVNRPYPKLA